MRLLGTTSTPTPELEAFSRWLLEVGDGRVDDPMTLEVELPSGTFQF
jgi:hypothetical protein